MKKLPWLLIYIISVISVLGSCTTPPVTLTSPTTKSTESPPVSVLLPATNQPAAATSSVPPTNTTTIIPVTTKTEEKPDTWQIATSIGIISSHDCFSYNDMNNLMESAGISWGGMGQGMSYVYENIDQQWEYLKESNTIILYKTWAEELDNLDDCPAEYKEVIPFTASELAAIKPPFAWLKRGDNNLIRAIIVARNKNDLQSILQFLIDTPVPVGIPWSISSGSAVSAESILPPTTSNSTIRASDYWITTGHLFLLTSKYAGGGALEYLETAGYHPGTLGGSVSYIYTHLPDHGEEILASHTIILFDVSFESLVLLNNWPAEYHEICPFNVSEYSQTSTPFAVVKLGENNKVRVLIVVKDEKDILAFMQALNEKYVPLDIPWTITDGDIVVIDS